MEEKRKVPNNKFYAGLIECLCGESSDIHTRL